MPANPESCEDEEDSSPTRGTCDEVNEQHGDVTEEDVRDDYEDDDEDESAIIEESPDGRWQRRNRKVFENDLSGCDCCCSYLAIDSDEGVEVVWNEVLIPMGNREKSLYTESQIQGLFKRLMLLEHPNIVKLHAYWTETQASSDKLIRAIFITEHADTGSLRQFLRNTRKTEVRISKACWRRWCIQVLCALHYLHTSSPPVVHGMLSSQTVFIQSDGVLKIGVVSPRLVHLHMSGQCDRRPVRDTLYRAPEYFKEEIGTAADIYAFGIVALEMLTSDMSAVKRRSKGSVFETIDFNDDFDPVEQACLQHFINICLEDESYKRSKAANLLQHPAIFETYSLKMLSAHSVNRFIADLRTDKKKDPDRNMMGDLSAADSSFQAVLTNGEDDTSAKTSIRVVFTREELAQYAGTCELNDFLEEVRNGQYPQALPMLPLISSTRNHSKSEMSWTKQEQRRWQFRARSLDTGLDWQREQRRQRAVAANVPSIKSCTVESVLDDGNDPMVRVHLVFEDNGDAQSGGIRQVTALVRRGACVDVAQELINRGFVNPDDATILRKRFNHQSSQ